MRWRKLGFVVVVEVETDVVGGWKRQSAQEQKRWNAPRPSRTNNADDDDDDAVDARAQPPCRAGARRHCGDTPARCCACCEPAGWVCLNPDALEPCVDPRCRTATPHILSHSMGNLQAAELWQGLRSMRACACACDYACARIAVDVGAGAAARACARTTRWRTLRALAAGLCNHWLGSVGCPSRSTDRVATQAPSKQGNSTGSSSSSSSPTPSGRNS